MSFLSFLVGQGMQEQQTCNMYQQEFQDVNHYVIISNLYFGFTLTPLTVNKMVCLYFYHPGGAPWFSWFFVFLFGAISGAFLCVAACFFLVRFSRVFCRVFSGVFWWFCWWYFLCFSGCFFHCILVLFSVHFFVLVPFLFYICFPLVVVLFFAVLFSVLFFVFFFCVFFVPFIVLFSCIFSFFLVLIFVLFFRALGGTQDKQPQYFAFWPVRFLVLFLVVTTSEDSCWKSSETILHDDSHIILRSRLYFWLKHCLKRCLAAAHVHINLLI